MKMQRTSGIVTTLKKNKFQGLVLPNFKAYYKATLIKAVWCWYKHSQISQWKRTGLAEADPPIYGKLIFDTGAKVIRQKKKSSTNDAGKLDIHLFENKNFNPYLKANTKIYPIWIIDLNVNPKTIQILKERIRKFFVYDLSLRQNFLDSTPIAHP